MSIGNTPQKLYKGIMFLLRAFLRVECCHLLAKCMQYKDVQNDLCIRLIKYSTLELLTKHVNLNIITLCIASYI